MNNEKIKTVTGYDLKNGMRVYVQGYIMEVSEVIIMTHPELNKDVVRFTGRCTADKTNDSIRNTSYNGGRYGQLATKSYCLAP